ncbi:hypothetical protein Tco_1575464, partial [Tanacetum coccineum]
MASTSFAHLSKQVLVEELKEKSVNESEVLAVVEEEGESWMTLIHEYLTDETLSAEIKKARAIKQIPEQTNTRINIANATQNFKMRNLGRSKYKQLGKQNAEWHQSLAIEDELPLEQNILHKQHQGVL